MKDRFGPDKGLDYFKEHGYLKWGQAESRKSTGELSTM